MALPKPTTNSDWTDGAASKVQEPSAAKKLLGWVALERPVFEFMNFLFFNTDEWIKYLESITDDQIGSRLDAIVDAGGGGTDLTLQSAHDKAAVIRGSKILIVSDLALDASVNITKPGIEIEMRSGLRFTRGGSAPADNFTALIVGATADNVRLKHLGWGKAGFTFGETGDVALNVAAGASDVFAFNPIFLAGITQNILDAGTNTEIANQQIVAV